MNFYIYSALDWERENIASTQSQFSSPGFTHTDLIEENKNQWRFLLCIDHWLLSLVQNTEQIKDCKATGSAI